MLIFTTRLIRLQNDLKDQYDFRNPRNGTYIVTKDFSHKILPGGVQSQQFYLTHFTTDSPEDDISNSREDLCKVSAIRRATNGKMHVENVPAYLVSLTKILYLKTY